MRERVICPECGAEIGRVRAGLGYLVDLEGTDRSRTHFGVWFRHVASTVFSKIKSRVVSVDTKLPVSIEKSPS